MPAPPVGSTIRVFLSHLPADYDLAVYAPADAALRPAVAGTQQLDSPPLVDTGVPLGTEQAALPPETLDDLRIDQSRPLVGVSANRGTEDEAVVAVSGGGSGNYLIQVTPYNGATSEEPYMLRVEVDPPRTTPSAAPLPPASGTAGTIPATLPAGTNTLFLWNRSQLTSLYGATSATSVLTAMQATQTQLTSLGFPSAIVGVDGNAAVASAYAAWNADPGDPDKANAVVRAINAVVDSLRAQANGAGIKYLVLVGGDRALPFARLEDYVTISNEADYAQSVGTNNELSAALASGRMLSDDPYAATRPIPYLNRQLFVPDLAVGRLVESPDEIVAALARYRTFGGRLDPATGRAAGYDFLQDGTDAVRSALAQRQGLTMPAEPLLIGNGWTHDDLANALLPATGTSPQIASVNGHADHSRLLPPAGVGGAAPIPFSTGDLTATAAPNLSNALVFSMGCHAGLDVSDAIVGVQTLDWPQAYGREGATYLGTRRSATATRTPSRTRRSSTACSRCRWRTAGRSVTRSGSRRTSTSPPAACSASTTRRRWLASRSTASRCGRSGRRCRRRPPPASRARHTSSRRRAAPRRSRSPRRRPAPTRSPASRWSGSTRPRPSRA